MRYEDVLRGLADERQRDLERAMRRARRPRKAKAPGERRLARVPGVVGRLVSR